MLIYGVAMTNVFPFKSQEQIEHERRCLHCRMHQLIGDFFAEFPTTTDQLNAPVDTGEVLDAIAKLVADMTWCQPRAQRLDMVRHLRAAIKFYEKQSRRDADDSRILN